MQRIAIDLDADDDDVTTTAVATPARAVSSTAAPKRRWGQAVKGVKNGLEGTLVRSSGLGAIGATVAVSSDGWLTLTGDDAMKSQSLQEAKAEWHQAMVEMQALGVHFFRLSSFGVGEVVCGHEIRARRPRCGGDYLDGATVAVASMESRR
eukprot:symbB.v1.2.000065.t1/scaffold2.1/size812218/19